MIDGSDNPFMTIAEAAKYLRIKRRTLDNLRWQGLGPRFRRHGGRIVYRLGDLLEWSEQRVARTTTTKSQAPPSMHSSRDVGRSSGAHMPEGEDPVACLEREPQYSHGTLHGDVQKSKERPAGRHRPA